jgi:putative hydrolase of the HAD superfamily
VQDIRAVLFDWGGVLIENPASPLMNYCARAMGISVEQYTRVHDRHAEPFQKGQIPEETFWQQVCRDLGRPLPKAPSLWGNAFRAVHSPRREVFEFADRLHANGYRIALLSNTEAPAMEFFLELRYGMFDFPIFSCVEGVRKPEKAVYEIAAHKLATPAGGCVLIDDNPSFIEGARRAGMKGIVYESLAQVKRDLSALGVRMQ